MHAPHARGAHAVRSMQRFQDMVRRGTGGSAGGARGSGDAVAPLLDTNPTPTVTGTVVTGNAPPESSVEASSTAEETNVVGGHVGSHEDGSVVVGRAVPGAGASSLSSASSLGPVAPAPISLSTPAPPSTKTVCCPSCQLGNLVALHVTELRCAGCQTHLRAGVQPALRVLCPPCGAQNLVPPNAARLKCGVCNTLLDVPGEEAELQRQRALASADDGDIELQKALNRSLKEQ